MKLIGKISFIMLMIIYLTSCYNHSVKKLLADFIGSKVVMPEKLDLTFLGSDSTDILNSDMKLVSWIDSTECSSCAIKSIYEWYGPIDYARKTKYNLSIILIFSPKPNMSHIIDIGLKSQRFDYPVIIDKQGVFQKHNPKLPSDHRLHTFLLDKNNRVVIVGDPSNNAELWTLYKTTISELANNGGVLGEAIK